MFDIEPVQQSEVLHIHVVQQLEKSILENQLKPGDRLPSENELALAFGVSRTVIREALMILRHASLIEVRHGVGTFVAELLPEHASKQIAQQLWRQTKSIWNVHEVRRVLEPQLAVLAAERVKAENLERLEAILADMRASRGDQDRFIELDLTFHNAIAAATQNPIFQLILTPVMDVMRKSRKLGARAPGSFDKTIMDHQRILDALKARDPHKTRKAVAEHISNVGESIRDAEMITRGSSDGSKKR